MHKMYAEFYNDVTVDFCLNVRKSPFPLDKMKEEDPELYKDFEAEVKLLHELDPLSERTVDVLRNYFDFEVPEVMRERAHRFGVAEVSWEYVEQGDYVAIAHGPIEAASNVETSMTQLVQNYTIRAQVRDLQRRLGIMLDRTERIANSLGKCAVVIEKLRGIVPTPKVALFAGRRSTDRVFLLLQNLFCAHYLPGYFGTSSIFAVSKIDQAFAVQGIPLDDRKAVIGRLIGTHAHEVMSVTAQLLSCFDDEAGSQDGPAGLSALLAHLMVLRVIGNLSGATALPDTFGTEAFVDLALATRVPSMFIADMQTHFPNDPRIPEGAVVFDIIKIWRLDSGSYERVAEVVISAWETRCRDAAKLGLEPPARPLLMHSNLSSADEVVSVCKLPERIRPTFCAFGGLADGFLPFDVGQGRTVTLQMASVVMKAVQARKPGLKSCTACAGKLGDDVPASKLQVDPRLPVEAREAVRHRMEAMSSFRNIDAERCSALLEHMYDAVADKRLLCDKRIASQTGISAPL
eukprot:jgi/Botrbrau1/15871/Bobra.40_1s0055.1